MTALSHPPERIRWTVELLDLRPGDSVLEIGCGAGHAVALVAARLTHGGVVTGIDRSPVMVARARALNAAAIAEGRARVERQTLAEAAESGETYGKVFAVNVNAFWTTPSPSLAALARLVRPGGTACLVFEPPSAGRLRELRATLPAAVEDAGFEAADVRMQPAPRAHVGSRSSRADRHRDDRADLASGRLSIPERLVRRMNEGNSGNPSTGASDEKAHRFGVHEPGRRDAGAGRQG